MKPAPVVLRHSRVLRYEAAAGLPPEWDRLCATLLQQRSLLQHYERHNPCRQPYYVLWRDGRLVAGAVVYSITHDLFSLRGRIPSPVSLNVIGLPASIPPAGVVGEPGPVGELLEAVFGTEPGLTVALNLRADQEPGRATPLRLLPDMILRCPFGSLASYRRSLRAGWRRRMRRIEARFARVETVREDCTAFSPAHHAQYLVVLAHADQRLETLGLEFFRELPRPIELVSCYGDGALLCWRLILVEDARLTFILGGHDYGLSPTYDSYFNNLFGLLADGLARGVREIELGQTAEDAKARLGAAAVEKRMLLGHSNRCLDRLVRLVAPWLAYRGRCPVYRVFRDEGVRP
jgi:hypothetical protein